MAKRDAAKMAKMTEGTEDVRVETVETTAEKAPATVETVETVKEPTTSVNAEVEEKVYPTIRNLKGETISADKARPLFAAMVPGGRAKILARIFPADHAAYLAACDRSKDPPEPAKGTTTAENGGGEKVPDTIPDTIPKDIPPTATRGGRPATPAAERPVVRSFSLYTGNAVYRTTTEKTYLAGSVVTGFGVRAYRESPGDSVAAEPILRRHPAFVIADDGTDTAYNAAVSLFAAAYRSAVNSLRPCVPANGAKGCVVVLGNHRGETGETTPFPPGVVKADVTFTNDGSKVSFPCDGGVWNIPVSRFSNPDGGGLSIVIPPTEERARVMFDLLFKSTISPILAGSEFLTPGETIETVNKVLDVFAGAIPVAGSWV